MKTHCSHTRLMPIADLQKRRHPKNPNTHIEKQTRVLAKIIEKQGWRAPIAVSNRSGLIVAGHARLAAVMLLGYTEAPVDFQDLESEELGLAHLVADNTIPEMAKMDGDVLQGILTELDLAGIDAELMNIAPGTILDQKWLTPSDCTPGGSRKRPLG